MCVSCMFCRYFTDTDRDGNTLPSYVVTNVTDSDANHYEYEDSVAPDDDAEAATCKLQHRCIACASVLRQLRIL